MVRGQGWKLIRYEDGRQYLYNLKDDPGETRNLADDPKYLSSREKLAAEMDKWLKRTGWVVI
jgi:arylsulfatase A-like enzyme